MKYQDILSFYKNKRVFLTGHTGFKGTWLTSVLLNAGANVCGYSLEPPTQPNLFALSEVASHPSLEHHIGDIRDMETLKRVFDAFEPEIVIHMAAQPIVRDSYVIPRETYETNVMGTVNILECIRLSLTSVQKGSSSDSDGKGVRSFLNVTTDKVYKNNEWYWGYREEEPLDGYDPYSNSKSCSELVTHAYRDSFFGKTDIAISTARAGNVIGGGDFANERIIPDCVRALMRAKEKNESQGEIVIRNIHSVRPYQHVLDPLFAYLMIAAKQYEDKRVAGYYNVGPDETDCATTGYLVEQFISNWEKVTGEKYLPGMERQMPLLRMRNMADPDAPHESTFLKLDCSKLKSVFGWKPVWGVDEAVEETVRFTEHWLGGNSVPEEMKRETDAFIVSSMTGKTFE